MAHSDQKSFDSNLLFGFLALQNDFIAREDLIAAVSVWLQDKSADLSTILVSRGLLNDDDRQLVSALAKRHLEINNGDAEQSLAGLSSIGPLRNELQELGNEQLDASLSVVSSQTDDSFSQGVTLVSRTPICVFVCSDPMRKVAWVRCPWL